MEKAFHRLINAADHTWESAGGGREWFETSVEFLDAVAVTLGFQIFQADTDA